MYGNTHAQANIHGHITPAYRAKQRHARTGNAQRAYMRTGMQMERHCSQPILLLPPQQYYDEDWQYQLAHPLRAHQWHCLPPQVMIHNDNLYNFEDEISDNSMQRMCNMLPRDTFRSLMIPIPLSTTFQHHIP